MKKILALMFLLCAVFAGAQVPTTPNIGLYIPLHNTPLWDNYMNPNFSMLDNFLSGHAVLPRINLGQLGITQYVDYTGTAAPTLPAAGFCRMYYDLASNQWTGLNSAGELCSSQNAVGSAGQIGYYAATGRKISPDACSTDGAGHQTCASYNTNGIGTAKIDFPEGPSPGNPAAGFQRIFASSVDHFFHCITHAGASCSQPNWASPTLTGTVTMPDGSVWSNSGINFTVPGELDLSGGTLTISTPSMANAFEVAGNAGLGFAQLMAAESTHGRSWGVISNISAALESDCNSGVTTFRIVKFGDALNFTGSPHFCIDDNGIYFSQINSVSYSTATNCAVNSVSPAACGSAAAGAFVVPTTTATYTVNTSAVTAHSRIFIQPITFASDLPSAPTCVPPLLTTAPTVSAVSNGVSFTMSLTSTTGQTCWMYSVIN